MPASEATSNFVKINRLKEGWTYNVSVAADDNSENALQDAKVKALAVIRELHEELNPVVVEQVLEEEVPY